MLLIDIGNTQIKWAFYTSRSVLNVCSKCYAGLNTSDLAKQILLTGTASPEVVLCASVGDMPFTQELLHELKKNSGSKVVRIVSTSNFMGLRNAYQSPEKLGVDRWLAMIATYKQLPMQSFVLADIGSALTLDFVDASGQHLGGYILPGVFKSLTALSKLGNLREIQALEQAALCPGRDTNQAIVNGLLNVFVSFLDKQAESTVTEKCSLVLTGGDAEWIRPHLAHDWHVKPNLVLEGLKLMADNFKILEGFVEI